MTEQSLEYLIRIKRESLNLLKDRGYIIPSEESKFLDDTIKTQEFKLIYNKILNDIDNPMYEYFSNSSIRVAMTNIYYKSNQKCLVYFADTKSTDKKISDVAIAKFCQLIINMEVNEAILISAASESTAVESLCVENFKNKDLNTNSVFIQFFKDEEIMFNPMNHILVPKHRIISKDEVDYLIKIDKVKLSQFPQISALDPICKRLGAKDKDVIEITRKVIAKDCLVDEEIAYRYVYMPQINKAKK